MIVDDRRVVPDYAAPEASPNLAATGRFNSFRLDMPSIRQFLDSPSGKVATGVVLLAGVGFLVWQTIQTFGGGELVADNRNRMFIDAETDKTFRYKLEVGMTIPVESPFSGKKTGYEAEACLWTKDGKPKAEPTWVCLNTHKGKPEPTFCPDCGRLVVALNPAPVEGGTPPPTEAEYKAKRGGGR